MWAFVHFMLSSLVLPEAGTLETNSFIFSRSTTFRKSTVFSRHYNTFFRDNKVTSQTPRWNNDQLWNGTAMFVYNCYAGLEVLALVKPKQRRFVSFQTIPCSYDYVQTK